MVAPAPTPLLDLVWLDPTSPAAVSRVVTRGGERAWRCDGLDGHSDHVFGLAALAADRFATAGAGSTARLTDDLRTLGASRAKLPVRSD